MRVPDSEEKVEAKRSLRTRQALSEQLGASRSGKVDPDGILDLPINFLENVMLSSKNELDDRLDIDEVRKARDKLLDALYGKKIRGGTAEEMNKIMIYKGRPLRAQLLHFAVWVSAQLHENSCVARLLPYLTVEDLSAKAKYRLKPGSLDEAWLDAIHVASGLGAVPVMQVLMQHVMQVKGIDSATYVNTPCLVHHVEPIASDTDRNTNANTNLNTNDVGENVREWDEDFYLPLHDATNAGNVELSLWLLAHGADACAGNKDGVSPLHFVAMRGIEGGLEAESQVAQLVQALLRPTEFRNWHILHFRNPNKQMAGKTPLELAALDGSRFPKHMMHVLAPCLNSRMSEPTFFSDIYFLVGLNEDAALEVVRELARRSIRQPELLHNLRFDCQLSGRTDMMAAIFFEAPSAASEMLDLLMVEPNVQDVAKHNVPNKTSFWGLFNNLSMRCTYRPDVVVQDSLLIPSWKFDTQKSFEQQTNIQWHADFIPAAKLDVHLKLFSGGALHIRTVEGGQSTNPDRAAITSPAFASRLDMDIIMAMSRIESEDLAVFSKLSIQGIVHCLWENLFQARGS
ncbi:Tnks [Symbiodinium pilosum]|uniref:Tnks protein n=1 Tax=Symbiodinium pilosum TaxID=2952 RepID=A0A812QV22_SYMPI|nr:Tnks [Symbiodinium pilosum]